MTSTHYVLTEHDCNVSWTPKKVKHLGWLLRRWKQVKLIKVYRAHEKENFDCLLQAHFHNGDYYESDFASIDILSDWLRRPVFYGLPIYLKARDGSTLYAIIPTKGHELETLQYSQGFEYLKNH